MMELLRYVTGDLFVFIGFAILLGMPLATIGYIVSLIFKRKNIKQHGYPPAHCDANGSLYTDEDD